MWERMLQHLKCYQPRQMELDLHQGLPPPLLSFLLHLDWQPPACVVSWL